LLALALLLSRAAHAQSNTALAEQLYLDGQRLMEQGKTDEACAKFADSQRLDRALGTLINLAVCHERQGKIATAWSEFTESAAEASKTGQRDRERFARSHAVALESKLQKLIVEIATPTAEMQVRLDGQTLPASALGTAIPLDPGDHQLDADAPGKKPWRQAKLNLGPSAVLTRVQINFEDDVPAPRQSTLGPTGAQRVDAPAGPATAEAPSVEHGSGQRTAGFIVGGVGLAGVGVGVTMLVLASGLYSRSTDEIHNGQKATGDSDYNAAVSDQTAGYVIGGLGVAALGVGAFLVLTSLRPDASAPPASVRLVPELGPGHAGCALRAQF
jgi:hypothetical protein